MKRKTLLLLLPLSLFPASGAWAEAAAPAEKASHAFGGVGLMLSTASQSTPLGDFSSAGGGIAFNGAGSLSTGSDIGVGFTGHLGFGSRTDNDDSSISIAESNLAFDGGIIFAKMLYLSLGMQFQNDTDDASDITQTYFMVPLGIGILSTDDSGYMLAQLKLGGGQWSNDADNSTEDVTMFGIRLAGQSGTPMGLQFMGALDLENYTWADTDITDFRFRATIGLGFGG